MSTRRRTSALQRRGVNSFCCGISDCPTVNNVRLPISRGSSVLLGPLEGRSTLRRFSHNRDTSALTHCGAAVRSRPAANGSVLLRTHHAMARICQRELLQWVGELTHTRVQGSESRRTVLNRRPGVLQYRGQKKLGRSTASEDDIPDSNVTQDR